jgi:hypothetical protein
MGSILVNNREISRTESSAGWKDCNYDVIGRKAKCGHVWCPVCGARQIKKANRVLIGFDWKKTRQVVLTFERRRYPGGGESAFNHVSEHKLISEFIRSLKKQGVSIIKFKWFLEWHRDGYPHWHIFIEVENEGVAGMIGHVRLRKAWLCGAVRESFYRTEYHWKRMIGYFMKTGYMEKDKKHQSVLPAWGMKSKKKIRRHGGSLKENEVLEVVEKIVVAPVAKLDENGFPDWDEKDKGDLITRIMFGEKVKPDPDLSGDEKTNGEIIASCGMKTDVFLLLKGDSQENGVFLKAGMCSMKYRDFVALGGDYLKTLGYRVKMGVSQWSEFYSIYIATEKK